MLTTAALDAGHGCAACATASCKKPFNLDEVLARIDHIFRRSEAAKELKGEAQEIEGASRSCASPTCCRSWR